MFGINKKRTVFRAAGKTATLDMDVQNDLPRSMIGRQVKIHGRERTMDVDGQRAYSGTPGGWKRPRVFWEDELRFRS